MAKHSNPMVKWPDKRMPNEAYQVTARYKLGEPIQRYSDVYTVLLNMFCGMMALFDGASLIIFSSASLIIFYLGNHQGKNALSFLYILVTFTTDRDKLSGLESYIGSYWLGLGTALVLWTCGLILIIRSSKELLRKSRAYECTEGFVMLEGKDTVIVAMFWKQILSLQKVNVVSVGIRAVYKQEFYIVEGSDGVKQEIPYIGLTKRIKQLLELM